MVSQLVRPEAGILLHDQLSPSQIEAGKRTLQLLQELCGATEPASLTAQRPHLDRLRRNRVVLIDGARGSGKTALLVTLLDALKKRCADRKEPWPPGLEKELSWEEPKKLVVPVDLIDLAPLPPTTNVLMHCVRRLDWVIRELEKNCGASSSSTAAAWHRGQAEDLPSRKAWKTLVRAITLGWDSRLSDRVERQDLESYARELEDAERQRDCLGELVSGLMKALTEDYRQSRSGQSHVEKDTELLFLFAIDDADMNPERTQELLKAVSLLYHPSLAFLLTGDSPLFELVLRRHYRELFCREQVQSSDESSRRYADRLALDVLDKLIPPGHRCELKPLAPKDRLEWQFQTLGQPAKRSLLDLMNEIKLDASSVAEQTLGMIFRETPQLAEVLPSHLRALVDFALFVEEKAKTTKESPLTSLVVELWERALRREGYGQNDSAWNWVTRSTDQDQESLVIMIPGADAGFVPKTRVVARHSRATSDGWRIQGATFAVQRLEGEKGPLQRIGSALRMAAAIATSRSSNVLDSEPSSRSGFECLLAAGEVYPSDQDESLPYTFAWPLPEGLSFFEATAFSTRWNPDRAAADLRLAEEFLRRIAQYGCRLGDERNLAGPATDASAPPKSGSAPSPYQFVAQLGIGRGGIPSRRYQSFFTWARDRAGLLAAPESGLSSTDANLLLAKLRTAVGDHDQWCLLRRRLKLGRQKRATAAIDERSVPTEQPRKSEDLLHRIDQVCTSYDWKMEIELGIGKAIKTRIEECFRGLFVSEQAEQALDLGTAELAKALLCPLKDYATSAISHGGRKDALVNLFKSMFEVTDFHSFSDEDNRMIKPKIRDSITSPSDAHIEAPKPKISAGPDIKTLTAPGLPASLRPRCVTVLFGEVRYGLMSGLHSLLWSIRQDILAMESEHWLQGRAQYFEGVSLIHGAVDIPWPMPNWKTSFAFEAFHQHWNHQTERWQGRDGRTVALELLLGYLNALTETMGLVFQTERSPSDFTTPEEQMGSWLSAVFSEKFEISFRPEEDRFDEFIREELPLVASIESGLSMEFCRLICHQLSIGIGVPWSGIHAARLRRLEVATGDLERAKALLAEFEAAGRKLEHPFQELIDAWRRRELERNPAPPSDTK